MKHSLLIMLALASCAPTRPVYVPTRRARITPADSAQQAAYRQAFDGHPPVEVMDLEAAPDSIATVVAVTLTDSIRKAAKQPVSTRP
jgi:hypothetical protein